MKYRKLKGDKIFNGYEILENSVLLTGEDGRVEDLVAISEAGEDIEYFEGLLSPAFINCHCHLELSHMKGLIPEATGLVDFVYKVVTERHDSEELIQKAIANAEHEMYENGIIAVGDICNNPSSIRQKQQHHLNYYNFIEASGWLPAVSQQRFERARELYKHFILINGEENKISIVPHAPYSVSENLWKEIQPYFKQKVVTIHNQETAFENDFFKDGSGDFTRMYELMKIDNTHHQPSAKTSLQSYFHNLTDAKNILLVHNTFTQQADIDYIKKQQGKNHLNTFFCLCINANKYIEDALPPVDLLLNNDCQIVLGTDSLASNWSLKYS
jgi:aminodeoxyfutalosine deaminase